MRTSEELGGCVVDFETPVKPGVETTTIHVAVPPPTQNVAHKAGRRGFTGTYAFIFKLSSADVGFGSCGM